MPFVDRETHNAYHRKYRAEKLSGDINYLLTEANRKAEYYQRPEVKKAQAAKMRAYRAKLKARAGK